jgi:hypothetical protein
MWHERNRRREGVLKRVRRRGRAWEKIEERTIVSNSRLFGSNIQSTNLLE